MHKFLFIAASSALLTPGQLITVIELAEGGHEKHSARVIQRNPNEDLIVELSNSGQTPPRRVWVSTVAELPKPPAPPPPSPREIELADLRRLLSLSETSIKQRETALAAAQTKADAQAASIVSLTAELETLKAAAKPAAAPTETKPAAAKPLGKA